MVSIKPKLVSKCATQCPTTWRSGGGKSCALSVLRKSWSNPKVELGGNQLSLSLLSSLIPQTALLFALIFVFPSFPLFPPEQYFIVRNHLPWISATGTCMDAKRGVAKADITTHQHWHASPKR